MIQGFSGGLLNRELIYQTDLPSFQRDFASLKTLDHGTGPAITFTRASGATYFDADGVLQTATNNTPRFDHSGGSSLGLLIEEARTNSIRNSQATGAVAGSTGTSPTHWTIAASGSGLTREIVGTGTEDGLPYIDIRYSGTGSGDPIIQITPETTTGTVSAVGQTWTASYYLRLVAGSTSGITSFATVWQERDATGTSLTTVSTNTFSEPTSAALKTNRISVVRTLTDASAVRLTNRLQIQCANSAIDITLRVGAPQLEQGAFPTSYIPTTTAAATRAVDVASVTSISSFFNHGESTVVAEASLSGIGPVDVSFPIIFHFNKDNNSATNRLTAGYANILGAVKINAGYLTGGVSQIPYVDATVSLGAANTIGVAVSASSARTAVNGNLLGSDSAITMNSENNTLKLGTAAFDNFALNGHIRKFAYWPKRLSNTLLQSLTA